MTPSRPVTAGLLVTPALTGQHVKHPVPRTSAKRGEPIWHCDIDCLDFDSPDVRCDSSCNRRSAMPRTWQRVVRRVSHCDVFRNQMTRPVPPARASPEQIVLRAEVIYQPLAFTRDSLLCLFRIGLIVGYNELDVPAKFLSWDRPRDCGQRMRWRTDGHHLHFTQMLPFYGSRAQLRHFHDRHRQCARAFENQTLAALHGRHAQIDCNSWTVRLRSNSATSKARSSALMA